MALDLAGIKGFILTLFSQDFLSSSLKTGFYLIFKNRNGWLHCFLSTLLFLTQDTSNKMIYDLCSDQVCKCEAKDWATKGKQLLGQIFKRRTGPNN